MLIVSISQYHKLGGIKQQKCIASPFWRLEAQNQGGGRALLPLRLWEGAFLVSGGGRHSLAFLGLPLTFQSLPLSSHGHLLVPSLCACWSDAKFPPFKDSSHIGLGPTLMTLFSLDFFSVKTLCPDKVTF